MKLCFWPPWWPEVAWQSSTTGGAYGGSAFRVVESHSPRRFQEFPPQSAYLRWQVVDEQKAFGCPPNRGQHGYVWVNTSCLFVLWSGERIWLHKESFIVLPILIQQTKVWTSNHATWALAFLQLGIGITLLTGNMTYSNHTVSVSSSSHIFVGKQLDVQSDLKQTSSVSYVINHFLIIWEHLYCFQTRPDRQSLYDHSSWQGHRFGWGVMTLIWQRS